MDQATHTDDTYYEQLLSDLFQEIKTLPSTWNTIEDASNCIHQVLQKSYLNFIIYQPHIQHNEEFKNALLLSLENVIMAALHEKIFNFICLKMQQEDEAIYQKCIKLSALKVTPDQLGALDDYSIPLPATIVELASLDIHETPADKLICLSTAFDLALAELKGAIVDVLAATSDNTIPILNVSDITPILATLIIHAKPIHLISNLCYIENFHWSKISNNESECLLAFKTAVDKLKVVTAEILLPRSTRIFCDIGLEDVLKLTNEVDEKFDRNGQRICEPKNPLERHIENFTNMITASTLSNL